MCKNNTEFASYFNGEECLGVYCRKCWKEWLLTDYIHRDVDSVLSHDGNTYFSPVQQKPRESPLLQVTSSREEIVPDYVAESVKPGDHVMWHRLTFILHHAIVEEVDGCNVTLIHFAKEEEQVVIHRKTVDARTEMGKMYLISYGEESREIQSIRAGVSPRRALIGTTGYQLLSRNCERLRHLLLQDRRECK